MAGDPTTPGTGLRTLGRLLTPRQRRRAVLLLALMLVGGSAELLTIGAVVPFLALLADPEALRRFPMLVQLLASIGAESRREQLVALTGLFMVAAVLSACLRLLLAWATQRFSMHFGHHLASEIHRRTLLQPYDWHVRNKSSDTIAALEQVQQLVFSVILPLLQGLAAALIAAFIVAALIAVDPVTAIAAAVVFAGLYAAMSLITRPRIAADAKVIGAAYGQRVQLVQESLGGIRDIIIDGSQAGYHEAFSRVDLRLNKARARLNFVAQIPRFLIEALGMVAIAALALVLASRTGGLNAALPVLGALALGAQRLLPLLQQLYQSWTYLSGHRDVIHRVAGQLNLPLPTEEEPAAEPLPFSRSIELRNVGYSYSSRAVRVLEKINLVIRKGSRVALIGRTGSGKSTLADLSMGLISPDSGQIEVDGIPLTLQNRRAWQRNIAHVSQAVFLTDGSIARNIAFGGGEEAFDMERIRTAGRQAALDDFITALPEGYATTVGERGVQLSGGQRQRLGLARAFYKRAPLLVLDEATSALDPDTEAAILKALDGFVDRGGTLLLIAHRSSTLAGCDQVVKLEQGRIAAVEHPSAANPHSA